MALFRSTAVAVLASFVSGATLRKCPDLHAFNAQCIANDNSVIFENGTLSQFEQIVDVKVLEAGPCTSIIKLSWNGQVTYDGPDAFSTNLACTQGTNGEQEGYISCNSFVSNELTGHFDSESFDASWPSNNHGEDVGRSFFAEGKWSTNNQIGAWSGKCTMASSPLSFSYSYL